MLTYTIAVILTPEAQSTFEKLINLPSEQRRWLHSTAVVRRNEAGPIEFPNACYWTTQQSTSQTGGLLGLIIGTIFSGPLGGLLGGLGLEAVLGQPLDPTFVEWAQTNLQAGDTAVFVLLQQPYPNLAPDFVSPEAQYHQTELHIDTVSALRQALAGYVD